MDKDPWIVSTRRDFKVFVQQPSFYNVDTEVLRGFLDPAQFSSRLGKASQV